MDQRIFDQLDRLERGAREEPCPNRHAYEDSSAGFSAYEGPGAGYVTETGHPYAAPYEGYEYIDEPKAFEIRDEQFRTSTVQPSLYQPRSQIGHDMEQPRNVSSFSTQGLDLSRFALQRDQHGEYSSSPTIQPSSAAFNASQRRPAPFEHARSGLAPPKMSLFPEAQQHARYQPLGVSELLAEERSLESRPPLRAEPPRQPYQAPAKTMKATPAAVATPVVQGISLVSTHALSDRFRDVFPFPLFNAIQSKSFNTIYNSDDNFVLSAPTGSGKTAILELAICRLVNGFATGSFKIVYQAPTKSLCSERQRDWQAKFAPLDLTCAELTGDTDAAQLRNVQHASIIVTTPEKWDSVTRKWKDHQKLMQMVKLFLIDEVHILKEDRGATLEAVVSRMKSVGSNVRFVALSATVPNSEDVATWLGKDPMNAQLPAARERFGEKFRPVRLQKHVCGYPGTFNDFAFDKMLNTKLSEVIARWSQKKPIMVFCFTRSVCVETAKLLTKWWTSKDPRERYWSAPRKRIVVADKDLRETVASGVAFHHAGLTTEDRSAVEKGYLAGEINVICCTSTLAMGVNLPCHMVIIKGTVTYQSSNVGCKEYSDLEVMQMLGRAGRPQFDDSAVAVIMTRSHLAAHYEKMITGQEVLESCLHNNLIDHLNAEIGLGTVASAASARKWLAGTFLYVRLKENPDHYKIDGDAPGGSLDERLQNICGRGIALLEEHDLVRSTPKLRSTEFGDAMARYYVKFDTMKELLALAPKAKISEILSVVCQAAEFKDVRFRAGEKSVYKNLNKNGAIKFPLPVDPSLSAHKVSLIIQAVLGAVDLQTEDSKQQWEFTSAKAVIFQHVHRLIRCIIDCQLYLDDSITARNALMLARSLSAQVWDDSLLHLKQLEKIGIVYVRKLVRAGITTIDDLESAEPHRLDQILTRNPPFGLQLHDKAKAFPKLRVSVKMAGHPIIKKDEHVTIKLKAEIGFLNEKIPDKFQGKAIYVCFLAETSEGQKLYFARISAKKLNKGQDFLFSAILTSASQAIRAYVMCEEIAGTMRHVVLRPEIPATAFPAPKAGHDVTQGQEQSKGPGTATKRKKSKEDQRQVSVDSNEFDDGGIDDSTLVQAEGDGFLDIDDFEIDSKPPKQPLKKKQKTAAATTEDEWVPEQLPNGRWACKHSCKDKTTCKHFCCREGLDKKPKPPTQKEPRTAVEPKSDPKQTQLSMTTTKKANATSTSNQPKKKIEAGRPRSPVDSKEARALNRLHESVATTKKNVPLLGRVSTQPAVRAANVGYGSSHFSFLAKSPVKSDEGTSDYGTDMLLDDDDLPEIEDVMATQVAAGRMSPPAPIEASSFDFGMFDKLKAPADYPGSTYEDDLDGNGTAYADGRDYDFDVGMDADYSAKNAVDWDAEAGGSLRERAAAKSDRAKEKGLFLNHSTSEQSASEQIVEHTYDPEQQLELRRSEHIDRSVPVNQHEHFDSLDAAAARPRSTAGQHQFNAGEESVVNAIPNDMNDDEPESEDSVQRIVKNLLGTEDFNYI